MTGKDFICFVFGLILLFAFGRAVYQVLTGNDTASVAKREKAAKEQAELEAAEKAVFEKDEARRSFALRESPVLWNAIEDLKASIVEQNGKIAKLEKTFADLGMDKNADEDYRALVVERDGMIKRLRAVEDELDQAYLASVKYEVSRGMAQKNEFERKASEDGVSEALQSRQKYDNLRKNK